MHLTLDHFKAFFLASLVHVGVLAMMSVATLDWPRKIERRPVGLSIEAVIVDMALIRAQREEARRRAEMERRRDLAKIKRQKELEARKERERIAEQQRLREQQKRRREAELERQRLADEELRKRQEEIARLRRQSEEQERRILEEQQKLRDLAERRKEAEAVQEQQRREELFLAEQLAADRPAQQVSLRGQYVAAITNQVTRNWLRPPSAKPGLSCRVKVQQIPGGEITSANISGACNGDEATRRSIIAAVMRAGYLPYEGFERVFERNIEFVFKYDGD